MVPLLENMQSALGPIGYAATLCGVSFAIGLVIGLISRKAPASAPPAPPAAPLPPLTPTVETSESKGDKRRNPRRPGRSVEVLIHVPGLMQESIKGVILNRSVGGLGILVGDEYQVGSTIGVLPAAASKLTPWVEVEVKSCRRSGEDWEIGVQFLKVPPYSTMVLFG